MESLAFDILKFGGSYVVPYILLIFAILQNHRINRLEKSNERLENKVFNK